MTPQEGTLERIVLDALIEKGSVTYLDFIGTGVTEDNIDQVIENLRSGMFLPEATKQ